VVVSKRGADGHTKAGVFETGEELIRVGDSAKRAYCT
jgi:hypothetical protein